MAPMAPISPLRGESDVYALLEFLKDPKKFKERLDQLHKLRKEINDLIVVTGPVEQIEKLRVQAQNDRVKAAHELKQAGTESESIRQKASDYENTVKKRVAERESESASLQVKTDQINQETVQSLRKRETEATQKYNEGEKMLARAIALEEQAKNTQKTYEDKLELIMGAVDQAARA